MMRQKEKAFKGGKETQRKGFYASEGIPIKKKQKQN